MPQTCCHSAPVVNARNPLKSDPTRTTTLRRAFGRDILRRFELLRWDVVDFIVTNDALGLEKRKSFVVLAQPRPRQFEFYQDPDKLRAFNDWFAEQVRARVFSVREGVRGDPWTAKYANSAYKQGLTNAFLGSKEFQRVLSQSENIGQLSVEEFLRDSFATRERLSKARMLATRSFEQLKGVTATMGSQMNQILAQGILEGKNPKQIGKEMSAKIKGLSRSRATLIAQTEIIRAHAEGQLDAFKEMGVEELRVNVEYTTVGDDRVCPICRPLEGRVFSIESARGVIPQHPRCRCSWTPTDRSPSKKRKKR